MTLKELIAKNEATRKRRAAEAEAKKATAPKKGRKPKKRAYLVNEDLPFENEVELEKEDIQEEIVEEEEKEQENA